MTLYVGTSGWLYSDWRGRLYPDALAADHWGAHYSDRFDAIEVPAGTRPPAGLVTAHVSTDAWHLVYPGAGLLLLRLTSAVPPHPHFLHHLLDDIPTTTPVAVELVGSTWALPEIRTVLESRGCATCWSDRLSPPHGPAWRTADWYYLRFYGGGEPGRRDGALQRLARVAAREFGPNAEGYAFFTNHHGAAAVEDAVRFAEFAAAAGLRPTRVPERAEVGLSPTVW